MGPLHGLPISLKDQIPIQGLECTMGELLLGTFEVIGWFMTY